MCSYMQKYIIYNMFFNYINCFYIISMCVNFVVGENKYLRSVNEENIKVDVNFRLIEKPFKMYKFNTLWKKAQMRLTEPKLKSLYSELTVLDKEERLLKKLKSEGGDKDGLMEAELRIKLKNLMYNYGLLEYFEGNASRPKDQVGFGERVNKQLFKDKKLNAMWEKAELSGFSAEELSILKQEFSHHQDKIDQYYQLLEDVESGKKDAYQNAVDEEELVEFNEISHKEGATPMDKDYLHASNLIREQHAALRDGYDALQRLTAKGPDNAEFVEPKVQGLWRLAVAANFSTEELASLKVELQHYESRLLKLRALHAGHAAHAPPAQEAGEARRRARHVDKMHAELEARILRRSDL